MDDDLGAMLATLLRSYHDAVAPRLTDLPHGPRGYQTLREVVEGAQPSQLALASRLGIDRTVMTYLIDDLAEAGLVERRANPADRRQRQVVATAAGTRVIADLCQHVRAVEDSLLHALTEAERAHLRALLAKVTTDADRDVDPCEVSDELVSSELAPGGKEMARGRRASIG
ncbi:MarR family winged helix-turn-helix transcriptional regulator [Pseudactinotalea suaedae]|uniref:MarR family winged helix-turn-helix transcriptional regulator n=1 Tax=Pseudactinotalea suaedae TaxID=1524924 RepID=UPI0012E289E7|nr:MarR family winged helix-turn-helix transcriptional regulator [Pseudactinotalea suaedae]